MFRKELRNFLLQISGKQKLDLCTIAFASIKRQPFSSSLVMLKKKQKFYNRYIEEYKPRIDYSFVDPLLEKTESKWLTDVEEDEPDYKNTIIREARRRRNIYEWKKMGKSMENKSYKRTFTTEQMAHVRFLHEENPELWTQSHLAMSFNVEPEVIRRILKSKFVPKPNVAEFQNQTVMEKSVKKLLPGQAEGDVKSYLATISADMTSDSTVDDKIINEIRCNPWFKSFDKSKDQDYLEIELIEEEDDAIELLTDEEHEDEHFCELYDDPEELEDDSDEYSDCEELSDNVSVDDNDTYEVNSNSETDDSIESQDDNLTITSNDNIHFYDNDGRFVYKIP
ncbi:uncharacterized protein LOC143447333 [Clavelina lepadiformis]|uniref:Neugrin n=1 Tax=Clavelina lepadiformis TaxID=159417 RepID=A0ABP0GT94_CLALP